ncbi:MAG: hypothetical protein R3C20_05520 [Planctomycetaceae bacterium]
MTKQDQTFQAERPNSRPRSVTWVIVSLTVIMCAFWVTYRTLLSRLDLTDTTDAKSVGVLSFRQRLPTNGESDLVSVEAAAVVGRVTIAGKEPDNNSNALRFSNIVIYIDGRDQLQTGEEATSVVLDQIEMAFVPHVVTLHVGQSLEIRNSDSSLHNVNGLAKRNPPFNVALTPGASDSISFVRDEFIPVACNMHPRMAAWVAVLPNRFHTRPDARGQFKLPMLPPEESQRDGVRRLLVWLENPYPPNKPHRLSIDIPLKPGYVTDVTLNLNR